MQIFILYMTAILSGAWFLVDITIIAFGFSAIGGLVLAGSAFFYGYWVAQVTGLDQYLVEASNRRR